jgi:hypothetical protein
MPPAEHMALAHCDSQASDIGSAGIRLGTRLANIPPTALDTSKTRSKKDTVTDHVIGAGAWADCLPTKSVVTLSQFCLALGGDTPLSGVQASHANQELTPLARWMLQDVPQEPCNNALHAKSSQVSNTEDIRHHRTQEYGSMIGCAAPFAALSHRSTSNTTWVFKARRCKGMEP